MEESLLKKHRLDSEDLINTSEIQLYILRNVLTVFYNHSPVDLYVAYLPGINSPSHTVTSRSVPHKL